MEGETARTLTNRSSNCRRQPALVETSLMEYPAVEKPDVHSEPFLRRLMRGQLRLSIACAAAFLVALLGLPLANYFLPELMARRIFGFTLSWFLLGILFFPYVWGIAWIFIRRSIALEVHERKAISGGTSSEGPI